MKTKDIYSPSFNKMNLFDCKNTEYDERKYKNNHAVHPPFWTISYSQKKFEHIHHHLFLAANSDGCVRFIATVLYVPWIDLCVLGSIQYNNTMVSSDDDFQLTPMPANVNHRQYLVTYSKANLLKFPSNRSFGEALTDAFSASGKVGVEYWACYTEAHADGESKHYHCSVKRTGPKR